MNLMMYHFCCSLCHVSPMGVWALWWMLGSWVQRLDHKRRYWFTPGTSSISIISHWKSKDFVVYFILYLILQTKHYIQHNQTE